MARNQRKYNTGYKMQAVKLSNEIGSSKAAVELGRLDIGGGAHTPRDDPEPLRGAGPPRVRVHRLPCLRTAVPLWGEDRRADEQGERGIWKIKKGIPRALENAIFI